MERQALMAAGPSMTAATRGAGRDEFDEIGEEWLLRVLRIVRLRHLSGDGAQLHRDETESLVLDTRKNLAHEAAGDTVGLDQDESAFGHVCSLAEGA